MLYFLDLKRITKSHWSLDMFSGVEGGFDNNEAEYDETHNIVILPDYVTLPFPYVELPEKVRLAVDAILMAEGAERKDQLQHGQLIRSKPLHMQ
ncbi:ubiquitin carboxyl-terminal hydrolase 14-like isoform X2 [Pistacia vera]|nr:ubiquitin carboxyl-terminal hydrolase 14-like isoform X2 [Pistacia vera]XP_031270675.1 ubiquitin carboxyl-terminal hydrolase 14-like isoform X2 [Pistacia vera]